MKVAARVTISASRHNRAHKLLVYRRMGSTTQWNNLVAWLSENGMKQTLVEYREFPETGRGLSVTRDTKANEVLFTIPTQCLLNMDTLSEWSREKSIAHLSAVQMLAAFLATYKAGSNSKAIQFYKPYIDSLPDTFEFHPLTWTMDPHDSVGKRMHEGLPPRVKKKLSEVRKRFTVDYFIIQSLLPEISIVDFIWGWLNVNTRSLYYRCQRANSQQDNITMCPLLDFANHSLSAPNFNTQTHRENGYPIPSMIAPPERGLLAGEQVFLLYGFHSNETMFTEYGFIDAHAPKVICIDGEVERLFESAKDGAEKSRILKQRGYWSDWNLHSEPSPAHPSYRLIPALRLLHAPLANEEMVRRWEETVAGTLEEVSSANTQALRLTLATLCQEYESEAVDYISRRNSGRGPLPPWQDRAMASIQSLWREQREVAELVMESITRGIEF